MNRLEDHLTQRKRDGKKALSLFVTVGYPTIDMTVPLVLALADAGADLIELGVPFSDPIADGPTIQQSSEIALRNGVTLEHTFSIAQRIRKQSSIPLVLMGYANPVYAYGMKSYFQACAEVGIDGTIIPDIPLEESEMYLSLSKASNIASIFLAAPTTPLERLKQLDKVSTGFLYCVSMTGVTGERKTLTPQAEHFLREARVCVTSNPLLVGFGITTPDDARQLARYSDGVIVGSALITIMQQSQGNRVIEQATEFARSLRHALDT
jgi:tryptophan synthase alpha chain